MEQFVPGLKAVTVTSEKNSNTGRLQMGVDRLNIKTIRQMPVVFGEADILRAVLTLPGVTSVGEATTGFNMRGGSAAQNLVLFTNSTIYNPTHFFGFFSSFPRNLSKELFTPSINEYTYLYLNHENQTDKRHDRLVAGRFHVSIRADILCRGAD